MIFLAFQLLLTIIASLPLLISIPVWFSWGAAAASFLISYFFVIPGLAKFDPLSYCVTWASLSALLWVLPLCLGIAYLKYPNRGWSAILSTWPIAGFFGSIFVITGFYTIMMADRRNF